jgi:Tol biopolymer transport system component
MNESTDKALVAWLQEGPDWGPTQPLADALATTRRTSQRPGWSFPERWLPMQLTMLRAPAMRPALILALVALLVLTLAATLLVVGSQRRVPPPFGPAANGAVVFEQRGDLLIADGLAGPARILVGGPDAETYPTFSNQGDRVAFVRAQDDAFQVLSVRPDGSDLRPLATYPGGLDGMRWSPDGSSLLLSYSETDPTGLRLVVVNADGSGSRHLEVGMPADWASWRPNGRQIAFRGQFGDDLSGAFVADADGSNVRRLPIDSSTGLDFEGLTWSPDGTHLAFMSGGREAGWQIGIADIDAEGVLTGSRQLTFDSEAVDEMLPAWSPDSSQLAFILMKDGVYQVALGRPDETGLRMVGPRIVDRNGLGYMWAPDGHSVLISARQGDVTMWSADPVTGRATALEAAPTRIPAWQRLAP